VDPHRAPDRCTAAFALAADRSLVPTDNSWVDNPVYSSAASADDTWAVARIPAAWVVLHKYSGYRKDPSAPAVVHSPV